MRITHKTTLMFLAILIFLTAGCGSNVFSWFVKDFSQTEEPTLEMQFENAQSPEDYESLIHLSRDMYEEALRSGDKEKQIQAKFYEAQALMGSEGLTLLDIAVELSDISI